MRRFIHWLAHLTGWYHGQVVTWWGDDDILRVGFRCNTCGKIGGHTKAPFRKEWVKM